MLYSTHSSSTAALNDFSSVYDPVQSCHLCKLRSWDSQACRGVLVHSHRVAIVSQWYILKDCLHILIELQNHFSAGLFYSHNNAVQQKSDFQLDDISTHTMFSLPDYWFSLIDDIRSAHDLTSLRACRLWARNQQGSRAVLFHSHRIAFQLRICTSNVHQANIRCTVGWIGGRAGQYFEWVLFSEAWGGHPSPWVIEYRTGPIQIQCRSDGHSSPSTVQYRSDS